jgi:hypothetical protein
MMGHGYYGNKDPNQHKFEKKFAWMPVVTGSKKRVWLTHYYIRYTFYDSDVPIHGLTWDYVFTKNEYLIDLLRK